MLQLKWGPGILVVATAVAWVLKVCHARAVNDLCAAFMYVNFEDVLWHHKSLHRLITGSWQNAKVSLHCIHVCLDGVLLPASFVSGMLCCVWSFMSCIVVVTVLGR